MSLCSSCPNPDHVASDLHGVCLPYSHSSELQCQYVPGVTLRRWCALTENGSHFGRTGDAASTWKRRCLHLGAPSRVEYAIITPFTVLLLGVCVLLLVITARRLSVHRSSKALFLSHKGTVMFGTHREKDGKQKQDRGRNASWWRPHHVSS